MVADSDCELDGAWLPVTLRDAPLAACDPVIDAELLPLSDADGATVLVVDWLVVAAVLLDPDCDDDVEGVTCWLPDAETLADCTWLGLGDTVASWLGLEVELTVDA